MWTTESPASGRIGSGRVFSPPSVRTRATVRAAIAASAASVPAMSVRRLRCAVDGGAGRATAVWTPSVSSLAVG